MTLREEAVADGSRAGSAVGFTPSARWLSHAAHESSSQRITSPRVRAATGEHHEQLMPPWALTFIVEVVC